MAHEKAAPKHWSAEPNSNYCRDPLAGWIVRYDPKPVSTNNADGTTTLSLNFPALAVTAWVGDPEQAAKDVADALNENDALRADVERLTGDWHEAIRKGEDQWAGWVREEVARKRAESEIDTLRAENERLRQLVQDAETIMPGWSSVCRDWLEEARAVLPEASS